MTYGLTVDGFTAPREADYLVMVRDAYEELLVARGYTVMPDWERDTLLGGFSEIMAFLLGQQSEVDGAVYDARSVANATGLGLANLCLIVGVTRREATQGTVTLRCAGTDGTVITQGKLAEGGGSDGKARWVCTEDGAIGDVTTGYVDLVFRCEDDGEIVATIGQIDTIVTTVAGWDTVTNAAAADPGRNRETDGELRARRQRSLQGLGAGNTNAIRSALLDLSWVTGAVVLDNKTEVVVSTDGVDLEPYSLGAVVAPNTLTSDQEVDVVGVIYANLSPGTAMSGDQTGTVTKADGRAETIRYFLATDAPVNVAYVLVLAPGYVLADVSDPLEALVTDYFLTFGPGETVYPLPLLALAGTVPGIKNVTTLTLAGFAVPVEHDADELPVLGTFGAT